MTVLNLHVEELPRRCNDVLKKKILDITAKKDELLFRDLKMICVVMNEICKGSENNIKQSWVSDLWNFVDSLLNAHYEYLIARNGVDDIKPNSFHFKGLRQDLAKFNEDWTNYSFGICTFAVTQTDYLQEVIMLLDFAIRLLKLKY